MPDFQELFMRSRGKPLVFGDKRVAMMDMYAISAGDRLRLTIERTNSDWRQGVYLEIDGLFDVYGQTVKNALVLWEDTAPRVVELVVRPKSGNMIVKNVWDMGDGVMQSWHHGAALYTEQIPKGRRYYCNDGHPDDNFNDIVFAIEREA